MEKSIKGSRDVRVELLRCTACFMVVLMHIRVANIADGRPLKSGVLIECLSAVCVGMFFLVSGFFLYDGKKTVWQTIRHFLKKILLPVSLVAVVTQLLGKWLMGEAALSACFTNADIPGILGATVKGILQMSSDYWGLLCGHLWYIAEYMKLMVFVPVMVILIKYAGNRLLFFLAALNVYYCVKIDLITLYGPLEFLPQLEPFLRPSQAMLVIGFLLYQNREKLQAGRTTSAALFAAYAASVLWMFYAQIRQLTAAGEAVAAYFTTWLSGIGMISTVLLAAFVLSLPGTLRAWRWLEKPILFWGKRSFMIYLLHYAVVIKLDTLGVEAEFRVLTTLNKGPLLYYAVYGTVVFVITTLLVLAVEGTKAGACRLWSTRRAGPGK